MSTEIANPTLAQSLDPHLSGEPVKPVDRAEIDASCALPVMVFFGSAVVWLIVGTMLAIVASIKMHDPYFLFEDAWLTFGRVRPAHLNTVIYGWASCAGIGTGVWLMARLCKVPLRHPVLLFAACLLWNIGVALGTAGILAGQGTSIEWLEFPPYATFILFSAYALIGIWAVIMFRFRAPGHVYVSQWYLFGAFFWFPWLYGTASLMLVSEPVKGSVQAVVNWWFAHNVLGLWFTPIGLASIYYLIPKVIGRPVYSYYLSIIGFWTLALFYSWNGMHHLIGGPVPSWLQSASIVASVMMVIPVVTTAINHHMTTLGGFHVLKYSPTLRFIVFGAVFYTAASLQGSSMALRSLNEVTHFTHYTIGHSHVGMYAFFTMTMFGSMYYIVPRLVGWEWPSAYLIRTHFWMTALGAVLMIVVLTFGGVLQGIALASPENGFSKIVVQTQPWLLARSLSGMMILIGHMAFAYLFVMMFLKMGRKKDGPTYLAPARKGSPA